MPRTSTRPAMLALQIFAATAFLAGTALSQVADSLPSQQTNSLREGAWALQFQMGQNFTLSSFDGATLSIQKHPSAGGAWRLGVTLSGDVQQMKNAGSFGSDSIRRIGSSQNDINRQSLDLSLTRIIYPRPPSAVNFFCGIGPRFSYGRSHTEITSTVARRTIGNAKNWTAGVGMVLGVQWFPYKAIGLSGEYGTSLLYRWEKREDSSGSKSTGGWTETVNTTKGLSLASGGVRLGVSVYW